MLMTVEHRNSEQSQTVSLPMSDMAHTTMETVMNTILSTTTARRTLVSTLTALILAAALPQAGFAANDDGIWKVNPARSGFSANSATLSIDRVATATNPATGSFIVI